MKSIAALSVASLLLTGASALAASAVPPEPDMVVDTCAQCHGDDGISPMAQFPNLAAQTKAYLAAEIKDFQDHTRADRDAKAYMWRMANSLHDDTVDKITEYFSALPPPKGSTSENPAQVAAGKTIYEQGIKAENVPACNLCHGPKAAGMATFPRLAGQHAEYIVAQLQAFRDKTRNNAIMNPNVAQMTDKQMHDVAAYLASL